MAGRGDRAGELGVGDSGWGMVMAVRDRDGCGERRWQAVTVTLWEILGKEKQRSRSATQSHPRIQGQG